MIRRRAFILTSLSAWVIAGCNNGEHASRDNQPVESLDRLGPELGLSFPASARIVGVFRTTGGMDDAIQAKIELPAVELPALLAQTQIGEDYFEPGTRGMLGKDRDFWNPHQSPALRTGQTKRPNGRVLNVGIDDASPETTVLFIVVHET